MTHVDKTPPQVSHSMRGGMKLPPKPKAMFRAISVNGVDIPYTDILAEAQNHPADNPGEALFAAARALVVRELLIQEARLQGIDGDPETNVAGQREVQDDAAIRILIDRNVSAPLAREGECRRYYENNTTRFRSDPIYEVRHILLPAPAEDAEARKRAKAKAQALIAHLQQNQSDFTELARQHSACPSKEQGGALGQVTKGSTLPEFEAALNIMAESDLFPHPVETRIGFHIVVLDRKVSGTQLPFDAVKNRISAWLEAASWSRAVSQYVGILAGNANILGIDLKSNDGPLVQ